MKKLTKDQIETIVDELDMGMKCFINKKTFEIKRLLPRDMDGLCYEEEEEEEEEENKEYAEVYDNYSDYFEFDKIDSHQSFQIMEEFAEDLPEGKMKLLLQHSLRGAKPFMNFKITLTESNDVREAWFKYKTKREVEYLQKQLEIVYRDF